MVGLMRIGTVAVFAAILSHAHAEDWNKDYQALYQARDQNNLKSCIDKGEAMLKTYAKDAAKVLEIYNIMTNCYRRLQKWDEAVAMYDRFAKEAAGNVDVERWCLVNIADTQRDGQRWDKAVEAYRAVVAHFPKEGPTCASARNQAGYIIKDRLQKFAEAITELEEIEKCDPTNAPLMASMLIGIGDCRLTLKDSAKAYPAYRRMLDNFSKDQPPWTMQTVIRNANRALTETKNYTEQLAFLSHFEEIDPDENFRSELGITHADAQRAAGDRAKTRADLFRIQSLYPTEANYLYNCQLRVVDLWGEEANFPEALSASRVLFDIAWDEERIVQACSIVAARFKAVDGNLNRANAFLKFQKFGPLGEDGKSALTNPLLDVPYPADPERLKVLKAGMTKTGDSVIGSRQRAFLLVLQGQAKESLKEFRVQFGRSAEDLLQRSANEWILIGAKAARGHATGLAPYYDWLNYGPAGKDGKAQNANPFDTLP
jgi:pentatricopeptide repeat protein